ncbi:hypothetical protein MED222_06120 [Vibrio sp. MED222]|nr:hypothetical protein MED222_06120 [Vibrio sp. MED222]
MEAIQNSMSCCLRNSISSIAPSIGFKWRWNKASNSVR